MDLCEFDAESYGKPRHFWEQAKRYAVTRLLGDHDWQRALEIGCGDCAMLTELARRHPECRFYGADTAFTPKLIEFFTTRPDFPRNITLSVEVPAGMTFDALFLFDVLEHIEDEKTFLGQMLGLLTPGATVAVTVPAWQSLFSEHDRFLQHFRRYRRGQLVKVLTASGLQVTDSGYLFSSLLPFRLMQKWLGGKPKNGATPQLQQTGPLNPVWAAILKTDVASGLLLHQLKLNLPGLSCFAICRKP